MPDSNTPWTPDDAFWNEAWADMETRLDRKRRRGLLLPLLLLLGVLGAGTLVLWPSGTPSAPEAAPRTASSAPAVVADGSPSNTPRITPEPTTTTATAPAPAPAAAMVSIETGGRKASTPTAASENGEVPVPETDVRLVAVKSVAALPTLPPAPLPGREWMLTPPPLSLEEGVITPTHPFRKLTLEAGATAYAGSYLPGTYLEAAHRIPAGRWYLPVALRYDYGRRHVTAPGVEDPREFFNVSNPVPPSGQSSAQAREEFQQARVLSTHTLGLRGGVGRRIGDRITLAGGLEAAYLLGGTGPTYAVLDSAGTVSVTVTEERFSRSGFGGGAQMDMSAGGGGGNRATVNPGVNRMSLSTWLGVGYRVFGRLEVNFGTTRYLTPLYQDGSPAVDRQRLELGIRYGW